MKWVAAGQWHTCAAMQDGTAQCWGENTEGALGDGTTTNRQLPTAVAGLPGGDQVEAVGAGHKFSCALLTSGAVKCWGRGDGGRLGNGSTANSTTPVTVTGLTAQAIALGGRHACAIVGADLHVECWGDNESGAVGNGTSTDQSTPQTVIEQATGSPLTSVVALAGGDSHTCAIKGGAPKTLYCWGKNTKGQVGDGTTTDRNKAVAVPDAAEARAVGAGELHTCALIQGSLVKCWGDNGDGGANPAGKLGDGSNNGHPTPMPTAGLRCDDCPTDPNKIARGVCGCGNADTDTDGDGTADCIDGCGNDPAKTTPGQCLCGIADTDTDSDGNANCAGTDLYGPIFQKWMSLGAEGGFLGDPTSGVLATPGASGAFANFEGGSIYWSPTTGPWDVYGAIFQHWQNLGSTVSVVGFPTSDIRFTVDQVAAYQKFEHGAIYSYSPVGAPAVAFELHGNLYNYWASAGWEESSFGHPTSGTLVLADGVLSQQFQFGELFDGCWGVTPVPQDCSPSGSAPPVDLPEIPCGIGYPPCPPTYTCENPWHNAIGACTNHLPEYGGSARGRVEFAMGLEHNNCANEVVNTLLLHVDQNPLSQIAYDGREDSVLPPDFLAVPKLRTGQSHPGAWSSLRRRSISQRQLVGRIVQ